VKERESAIEEKRNRNSKRERERERERERGKREKERKIFYFVISYRNTGRPRYMREIGTPKKGLHIMNLHIKRPWITVN